MPLWIPGDRRARRMTALLCLLLMVTLAACGQTTTAPTRAPARTTVVITPAASRAKPAIFFGTAVQYQLLQTDLQYRRIASDKFNLLTPENDMKFGVIEQRQGTFDFARADAIMTFARANGLWLRGHTLVWGQDLPDWLVNGHFTRQQTIDILKTYILTVVGHFKGQVIAWDVVNEALDGSQLKNNFWLQTIGPEYIPLAFEWAHQTDPQTALFYNDWGDDEIGPKFDATLSMINTLRSQGAHVDGVGMETHIGFGSVFRPEDVVTNMARLKAAGLDVEVSEMDVQLGGLPGDSNTKLQEQANIFGQVAAICKAAGNCRSFTVWGVCDRYTWLSQIVTSPQQPLLFDVNYQPKPAYAAVVKALGGA